MASRYEVEVTLASAKDIKNVNWRYGPTKPYAIMWFDPDRKIASRTDDEGDTKPKWNQKLMVPLNGPAEDATLHIDVVHYAGPDEDTKPFIGSAKLDLREVVDEVGFGTSGIRKLKLKRSSGRPQGKLEIEVIVRERHYSPSPYPPYPPPGHHHDQVTSRDVDHYGAQHYGGYGQPPTGYEQNPGGYGQHPGGYDPNPTGYGQPPAGYGQNPGGYESHQGYGQPPVVEKKKSSYGGIGTGIAIGAAAGILGGLALAEGYDQFTDHVAEEASEKVEEDQKDDDDDSSDDDDE